MASWSTEDLCGPDGEDWRVPVKELRLRLENLSHRLAEAKIPGVLIQNPVDLYYFAAVDKTVHYSFPAADSNASINGGGGGVFFSSGAQ